MVHALASPAEHGGLTAGLVAAARGDGVVAVYDTGISQRSAKMRKKGRQSNAQVSVPVFAEQSHAAAVTCMWVTLLCVILAALSFCTLAA